MTLLALRSPARLETSRPVSPRDCSFLERKFTPRTVFMEIGAADCSFALRAASYVERVYAIDVSGRFLQSVLVPLNLRLVLCNGVRIPVPESSVDLAWSGDFMEHLHPDDASAHLENVRRALNPGGEYVCETASPREMRRRMLAAGFGSIRTPFLSLRRSVRITAVK